MKKLVTAIVIASIGAAFAERSVVYDYKASIKRLDLTMKTKKVKGTNMVLQKFAVKSDTIQGYVTLPECVACLGPVTKSSKYLGDDAFAYLTLKGDKFSKVISRPEYEHYAYFEDERHGGDQGKANRLVDPPTNYYLYVLKAPAAARAAMFGADQIAKNGNVDNSKQMKNAWLALDFNMPRVFSIGAAQHLKSNGNTIGYCGGDGIALEDVEVVGKLIKSSSYRPEKNGLSLVYLGFLGMGDNGFGSRLVDQNYKEIVPTKIQNAGFGTIKSDDISGSDSICLDDEPGASCVIINTISGSIVGYPYYKGICDHTPMWDFCDGLEVQEAVVSGTFSLKFNKKLTASYRADGEQAILDKFKVPANYMYEVDETGYAVDVRTGAYILRQCSDCDELEPEAGGHLIYPTHAKLFHEENNKYQEDHETNPPEFADPTSHPHNILIEPTKAW